MPLIEEIMDLRASATSDAPSCLATIVSWVALIAVLWFWSTESADMARGATLLAWWKESPTLRTSLGVVVLAGFAYSLKKERFRKTAQLLLLALPAVTFFYLLWRGVSDVQDWLTVSSSLVGAGVAGWKLSSDA